MFKEFKEINSHPLTFPIIHSWLQYFSKESLSKEFEANGFRIEHLFSDVSVKTYTPNSSEMAAVTKKS
jgi:hypothetical protein